jgi:hypothetical protein
MSEADDPIMLSALQHWSYCPRQCAPIHVEQVFDENIFTMRGNAPANSLFSRNQPNLNDGVAVPRDFSDYTVSVGEEEMPPGVTLERNA